jgi:hypothetical protein
VDQHGADDQLEQVQICRRRARERRRNLDWLNPGEIDRRSLAVLHHEVVDLSLPSGVSPSRPQRGDSEQLGGTLAT